MDIDQVYNATITTDKKENSNTSSDNKSEFNIPKGVKISDDVKKFLSPEDPKKPPRSEQQQVVYSPDVVPQQQEEQEEKNSVENKNVVIKEHPVIEETKEDDKMPLPQHHKPIQTSQYQMDEHIKPTYVPKEPRILQPPKIVKDKTEEFYETIQLPLFAGVLFFIFQLPWLNTILFKYMPSLFIEKSSAPSLVCYVLKSILFSLFIYFINNIKI